MRSQFEGLFAREILRTFRIPCVLVITIVQPFMWLAFFGSSFAGAPTQFLAALIGPGHTYIAFLLPGTLSTSMLGIGMFGSMSTIQDKRFGFMKRILITPTSKFTIFLSKALGATARGLVQIPVMIVAALAFGVRFPLDPVGWAAGVAGLCLLALGFSCLFLGMTATSTDWQTPGVIGNFITMPLMFSSSALFPSSNFAWWMRDIAAVNPVTFSALLGRGFLFGGGLEWSNLGYLAIFAMAMLVVSGFVASRWLRVE